MHKEILTTLQERTAQYRARPTGGAATAAQEGDGLQSVGRRDVTTQHKPVVFEVCMKKCKEKRTMGPKNIKWWKCKDEMMVKCRKRVRKKYEKLDAEKGTVEGQKPMMVDGRGGEGSGEAGSMEDDRRH